MRKQVYLCNRWKSSGICASKLISRPTFKSLIVFDKEFCAIEMNQVSVTMDVAIPIGFTVLELSKVHMYKFYYDYLLKKFNDKITLAYLDTDAFFCAIRSSDVYEDFREDIPKYFDTSGISQNILDKLNYPCVNKKRIGFFKDECSGHPISIFMGLSAKNYIYEWEEEENEELKVKKCVKNKGVNREIAKKMMITDFKDCLENERSKEYKMRRIQHINHVLKTYEINKIALSPYDNKRVPIPNSKFYSTYAYGHYKIKDL
jgi:hypothetical protein